MISQDEQAVKLLIDTLVGIPKFTYAARKNNSPKPPDEFAHIRSIEEYQIGIPYQIVYAQDDDTTTYRTVSLAKLRVRVGINDTDGLTASKIMHGWTTDAVKELMKTTGYGFVRVRPLSNEDAKLEKEWETRIGFSIELYVTRIWQEVVDNIRTLEISGEFVTDTLDSVLSQYTINDIGI